MALTYTNFTSFSAVEAKYNEIKPLRGPKNVGKDVRPIGDRARRYERIVKIDDNCYALTDGYDFGDQVVPRAVYVGGSTPWMADESYLPRYAPIVWRRHEDGSETVTIRNGFGPYAHTGRYDFIKRHTPMGMRFSGNNGKQFIKVAGVADPVFLAKDTSLPQEAYDTMIAAKLNSTKYNRWMRPESDGFDPAAVFKKTDIGMWELVTDRAAMPKPPKIVVDKDTKAELKPHIASFFAWMQIMIPLIPTTLDAFKGYNSEWTTYFNRTQQWSLHMDIAEVRAVIQDPAHELRVALAAQFIKFVGRRWGLIEHGTKRREEYFIAQRIETDEEMAELKVKYNRWINRVCGLNRKVEG